MGIKIGSNFKFLYCLDKHKLSNFMSRFLCVYYYVYACLVNILIISLDTPFRLYVNQFVDAAV